MKKKIIKISIFIILTFNIVFVGLSFNSKKVSATIQGDLSVRLQVGYESTVVLCGVPYDFLYYGDGGNDNIPFIVDSNGNSIYLHTNGITLNDNGLTYRTWFVNNDSSKPLNSNDFYLIRYDNVINRYIFYQVVFNNDYDANITVSDLTFIELFTISFSTGYNPYFDILACNFITKFDITSSTSTEDIKDRVVQSFNQNPYTFLIRSKSNMNYNRGYTTGYNTGYDEGQTGENAISPVWNVLTGIFNSIGAILSIELIPHIPIGLLIFVPLFFIMVMAILSIWRKNW